MEEKQEQPAASGDKQKPNLCEQYNSETSNYKCPECAIAACSGKRPLTDVVPISQSQFDDSLLLSDCNILDKVKPTADSSKRMRISLGTHDHEAGSSRAPILVSCEAQNMVMNNEEEHDWGEESNHEEEDEEDLDMDISSSSSSSDDDEEMPAMGWRMEEGEWVLTSPEVNDVSDTEMFSSD